jgi:hypothetical protein
MPVPAIELDNDTVLINVDPRATAGLNRSTESARTVTWRQGGVAHSLSFSSQKDVDLFERLWSQHSGVAVDVHLLDVFEGV